MLTVNESRRKNLFHDDRGIFLTVILIFGGAISVAIVGGVSAYALFEHRASARMSDRDLAFHIAEAGVEYYRWHLVHNPVDYRDGAGHAGPFIHEYHDKTGAVVGSYSLEIDPPPDGTSLVIIRSTGWTVTNPDTKRTVQARVGFPMLTDYALLTNASTTIGTNDETHGVIFSNDTIRFDGVADSWVKSAVDHGITGGGGPKDFWVAPVAPINFQSVTADLAVIRDAADTSGVHLFSSGKEGWHIQFTSSTYTLYKVNTRRCYQGEGKWKRGFWEGQTYCYDTGAETLVSQNTPLPANGAFFSDDDLWLSGTVDGAVSIGVGTFPVQPPYKRAYIHGNLLYAARAGDDALGLAAQGDVIIPHDVPAVMEADGAFLSQFGKVYRPYYDVDTKTSLSLFGSDISFGGSVFRYVNGWGSTESGFEKTVHTFDGNLRLHPPRGFPVNPTYEVVSWEEL